MIFLSRNVLKLLHTHPVDVILWWGWGYHLNMDGVSYEIPYFGP